MVSSLMLVDERVDSTQPLSVSLCHYRYVCSGPDSQSIGLDFTEDRNRKIVFVARNPKWMTTKPSQIELRYHGNDVARGARASASQEDEQAERIRARLMTDVATSQRPVRPERRTGAKAFLAADRTPQWSKYSSRSCQH